MNMSTNDDNQLCYLDELPDYKVASEDCDVRGWEVKDKDSRSIGKVDGLLVNKAAERVVYLDVEVNESLIEGGRQGRLSFVGEGAYEFSHKDGDDHLIIPIGMVKLDEENKTVCANEIEYNTFVKASRFSKGNLVEREYEITLLRHYLPAATLDYPANIGDSFYNGQAFKNTLSRKL
ncbi:MAG: PRC-barrel domain-containing protein [Chitinophagaceae bacterium]